MALTQEERQQIVTEFRKHGTDTGSTAVQIALLTNDIKKLTEHLKVHEKDFHTQRGLMKKVGRRNRLLRYLHRKNPTGYQELIQKLGLRK
ncbi:MAG: 30S ribosomal protein S15 [Planctomycetota bacterium]